MRKIISSVIAAAALTFGGGLAASADVEPQVAGSTVKYVRGYETKAPLVTTNTSGVTRDQAVGTSVTNVSRVCPWNSNRKLLIHSTAFSGFLDPGQCYRPSTAGTTSAYQFLADAPEN